MTPTPKSLLSAMILLVEITRLLPPFEDRRHGILVIDGKLTLSLAHRDGFIPVNFDADDVDKSGAELAEAVATMLKDQWQWEKK